MSEPSPTRLEVHSREGIDTVVAQSHESRTLISSLLRTRNRPLNTRCGERGLCDACRIGLIEGSLQYLESGEIVTADMTSSDHPHHGAEAQGIALRACEMITVPGSPAVIRIPDRSLLAFEPQVIDDFRIEVPIGRNPLWQASDQSPAPTQGPALGAAIDIGTTTVALMLIDLATGKTLSRQSMFNQQTHLGDDVLTRINLCMNHVDLVDRMQESIVNDTIAQLLDQAVADIGASRDQVVVLTTAGNATMLHLLIGVDPTPMGVAPFTPNFIEHRLTSVRSTDFRWPTQENETRDVSLLKTDRDPDLHLLPGAAAYVGADIVASSRPGCTITRAQRYSWTWAPMAKSYCTMRAKCWDVPPRRDQRLKAHACVMVCVLARVR